MIPWTRATEQVDRAFRLRLMADTAELKAAELTWRDDDFLERRAKLRKRAQALRRQAKAADRMAARRGVWS